MGITRDNRLIFETKNNNRKRYFSACAAPEKYTARKLRRADGGAFGRLRVHDPKNYDKMVIGTRLGPKL